MKIRKELFCGQHNWFGKFSTKEEISGFSIFMEIKLVGISLL